MVNPAQRYGVDSQLPVSRQSYLCLFQSGDTQTMTCKFCEQGFTDVSTLKDHLDTTCPDTTIPCSQAENGCTWKGRRLSLETHVDKCPYESIKGFFSLHKTNMGQLSKENERLRRRTDELEGLVRILRKELDWVKIVLEPWYRPVYPERPSMTINCDQYPNNDGPGSGPGSRRAGPTHLQGMDLIAGDASNLAPRVENGVTEGVDIFDPFSFLGRTQNHAPNVRTGNDVPLTTALAGAEPSPSPSVHTSSRAVEPRESQNLGTTQGPSPSGPGSTRDAAVLSPRTNEVQSTSITPLPDHFPPENREVFEDGSLSQPRGWSHLPPLNSMSSNPSPSIQIPVSICIPEVRKRTVQLHLLIAYMLMNRISRRPLYRFIPIQGYRIHIIDLNSPQVSTSTLSLHST